VIKTFSVSKNIQLKNLIRNNERNLSGKIKIKPIKISVIFHRSIVLSSNPYLLKNVRCCCQIIKRGIIVTAKAINSSDSSSICENVLGTSSDIIKRVIENAKTASLKFLILWSFHSVFYICFSYK
jgi:hypothetical protein